MNDEPASVVASTEAVAQAPLPDAPYRGIQPFRFIDQQIFAARDDEIWTLFSNVTLYRAVLLYGESGTGKSSLVNAGLLPKVLRENYVPDRLRVQPLAGREIKIERIRMSGRGEQTAYLPSNFVSPEAQSSTESVEMSLPAFRARIEQFRLPIDERKVEASFFQPNDAALPLLIFDQFEEFITLFEEAQRGGARGASGPTPVTTVQQNILRMLVELIRDQTLPIKIIFSFREDYLAKLSLLFDHCPELLDQSQRLLPPHVDTLPQIIRAPFVDAAWVEHYRQRQGAGGSELSEDLAKRISAELSRRSEGDRANLTELQIVCQRLWNAPDPEKLFGLGIEEILKGYGTDVFKDFTPELRDVAVVLLSHMITASNTRNIVSEGDLLGRTEECDFPASECSEALAALSRSQIVRREVRRDIAFYEITSEYLVPWIRDLVVERKAAEEQRAAEAARKKLELEREAAVAKFEAEQRRALVFKRVLAGLIAVLAAAVLLGIFAWVQYTRRKRAEGQTVEVQDRTDRIFNAFKLINSQDQNEALEGVTQVDKLINEKKIPSELKRSLLSGGLASPHLEVKKAALKVLIYAAQNDPELVEFAYSATDKDGALERALSDDTAANFQNLTKTLAPRIYMHISDESQRDRAKKLANALTQTKRYLVPGIDNVGNRAPIANQLRFFKQNDPTVRDIMTILNQTPGEKWVEAYTPGYENSDKIRPGHFELWFAGGNWLRAWPVDEQGNYIPKLRLTYVITDSKGKSVTRHTTYTSLAPGDYEIKATFEGYEPVKTQFTIESGKETQLKLYVTKTGKKRDS